MSWKDSLKLNKKIVLATCSKYGIPNAIVVNSKGFVDDKLLINACQMKTTLNNLRENNKICIVAKEGGKYYKIKGHAKIYSSGKYFDTAMKRNIPPPVKFVIVVNIEEVFDLDKNLKLFGLIK